MSSAQLVAKASAESSGSRGGLDPSTQDCPSRLLLGMRVDGTSYAETANVIANLAASGVGGMVFAANVHMVMEAFDDPAFRRIVNSADRVTPDGVPLVWALRLLGLKRAQRVYGPSLLAPVCEVACERELSVGFYGGSPEVLDELALRFSRRFPELKIVFAFSPPFRPLTPEEEARVVGGIADAGTRILFVGLGCPKQERWVAAQRRSLSCVMVAVGAAFDFHAGSKPQAPGWLQRAGLEWAFRLCCEPSRLWHRYLYHGPRFLYHFAREYWARDGSQHG